MHGTRDTDWTHIRVPGGNRAAAAPYVPIARKLLGTVKAEAEASGLGVHKQTQRLPDGAIVQAELFGAVPRITIYPVGRGGGKEERKIPDAFVVTPRNGQRPDGPDPEHPEVILEHNGSWIARFFDDSSPEYAAVAKPRGTYRSLAGRVAFPEGIRHGGNVDWRSDESVRVSWYGPSSRYWFDGWRMPSAQYQGFVFMLGQVLLDVEQYAADSNLAPLAHPLVMGAAIDLLKRELYVIQAAIEDPSAEGEVPPFPPVEGANVTPPSPTGDFPVALYRYRLTELDKPDAMNLKVIDGSHAILWSATLHNACNPWFFNQDITAATSYSTPDKVSVYVPAEELAWTEAYAITDAPSPSTLRFELAITEDAITGEKSANVSQHDVSMSTGSAPIATDYDKGERFDLFMRRGNYSGFGRALSLESRTSRFPIFFYANVGGDRPDLFYHAEVFWMDLREDAALMFVTRSQLKTFPSAGDPVGHPNVGIITVINKLLVADGKIVDDEQVGYLTLPGRWTDRPSYFLAHGAADACSPMALLYYVFAGRCGLTKVYGGLFGFAGMNSQNAIVPEDECFGTLAIATTEDGVYSSYTLEVADQIKRDDRLPDLRDDEHGRRWLIGAAAHDGDAIFSLRIMVDASVAGVEEDYPLNATFITDSTLAARTGIGGEDASYEPVWLLGALPRRQFTTGETP
ncbi:MAG TPA: hypothetical protein VFE72_08845 [Lysobacter sp.]|nr:hypothetical protein [Lysobacter sp.]